MSRLARYVGATSTWTATMTSPSRKKCSTKSCFHNLQGQEKILVALGSRSWFCQALGRSVEENYSGPPKIKVVATNKTEKVLNLLLQRYQTACFILSTSQQEKRSHFSKKSIITQCQCLQAVIQIYNQPWKNQGWHLKKWQAKITKARHTLCQTSPKFPLIYEGLSEVLKELCHRNVRSPSWCQS